MADVDGRDAVFDAQVLDRREHGALGGHVQASGRFVKDDQARTTRERDRDRNPLLLAAGELVGIRRQHVLYGRQPDLAQQLFDTSVSDLLAAPVRGERFDQLRANPPGRVQRRCGILRYVGKRLASQSAQLLGR